ncbi:MAG: TetR/AcrR family transcriptional regulator [Clostridiales bacterium]|nr:TetR/AcrR family transcriptional regulator [Clostridiales bacterium]
MPPKAKITEEQILDAVFTLTRNKGFEVVNARSIAKELGCSTHPIFRIFENMAELKVRFMSYVEKYYTDFITSNVEGGNSFLSIGLAYIDFASTEKNLFKMLFMSENFETNDFMSLIENEENQPIISAIQQMVGVNEQKAKKIYINTWLYTHGIASMVATNNLSLTEIQIEELLKSAFIAFKN